MEVVFIFEVVFLFEVVLIFKAVFIFESQYSDFAFNRGIIWEKIHRGIEKHTGSKGLMHRGVGKINIQEGREGETRRRGQRM